MSAATGTVVAVLILIAVGLARIAWHVGAIRRRLQQAEAAHYQGLVEGFQVQRSISRTYPRSHNQRAGGL